MKDINLSSVRDTNARAVLTDSALAVFASAQDPKRNARFSSTIDVILIFSLTFGFNYCNIVVGYS